MLPAAASLAVAHVPVGSHTHARARRLRKARECRTRSRATLPSCWCTLRLYIMTAPSRTSSREFSVRGCSGSSGGRPSSRPSFQWLPSTRKRGKGRVRAAGPSSSLLGLWCQGGPHRRREPLPPPWAQGEPCRENAGVGEGQGPAAQAYFCSIDFLPSECTSHVLELLPGHGARREWGCSLALPRVGNRA